MERVRIEVLGTFRLLIDNEEIEVGRRQVRAVLTLLATRATADTPSDHLVDHLWSDQPPKDPAASLRVVMTRVRAQLGDARGELRSSGTGHRLTASSDLIDALTAAATASALDRDALRAAMALWRGTPFVGADDHGTFAAIRTQLDEAHRTVIATFAERCFADDAPGEALGALHGHNETTDERLIIATARSLSGLGRRAEAIGALDGFRQRLRELGLSPSDAIAQVEHEVLANLETVAARQQIHVETGPSLLVGRSTELAALAPRQDQTTVILAEAGAGKTALLRRASEQYEPLIFYSVSSTPSRPMEALGDIIVAIAECDAAVLSPALGACLARLAPSHPAAEGAAAPGSRSGLLVLAREVVSDFLARHPRSALIIDDVQWLDRSSSEVVRDLIDQPGRLILASRRTLPAPIEDQLGEIDVLELKPLTDNAIGELVRHRLSSHGDRTSREILERSGGNALYANLLVDLLAEGQQLDDLPASVMLTVRQRIDGLPSQTQSLLQTASAFESDIPIEILSQLIPNAEDAAEPALRDGLLVHAGSGALRFSHAVVQSAVFQFLPVGLRAELHDEISRLLESAGHPLTLIAEHADLAASLDPERAVTLRLAASSQLAEGFGWSESEYQASRGMALVDEHPFLDPVHRAALKVRFGLALNSRGDLAGDDALHEALHAASELGEDSLLVEALIGLARQGRLATRTGPLFLDAYATTKEFDLNLATRARLQAATSTAFAISPHQIEGRRAYREAAELAQALPPSESNVRTEVFLRAHLGCPLPEDLELREFAARELRRLADEDPDLRWEAAFLDFGAGMAKGEDSVVAAAIEQLRSLGPRIRRSERDFGTLFCEAAWHRYVGDLERAERLADETLQLGNRSRAGAAAFNTYASLITSIRTEQGRLGELLPFADDLIASEPNWPTWRCLAAAAAAHLGDNDRAAEELAWLMRDQLECLSPDVSWPAMLSLLSVAIEGAGDRAAASAVLDLAQPLAGLNLFDGVCIHRRAEHVIATCQTVLDAPVKTQRGRSKACAPGDR